MDFNDFLELFAQNDNITCSVILIFIWKKVMIPKNMEL